MPAGSMDEPIRTLPLGFLAAWLSLSDGAPTKMTHKDDELVKNLVSEEHAVLRSEARKVLEGVDGATEFLTIEAGRPTVAPTVEHPRI